MFFPFYNDKYKGMIRHGATATTTTRKGHPDIIKTESDGTIIAVECSTVKDYWRKPTLKNSQPKMKKPKTTKKGKPINDIDKCVDILSTHNIREFILCSSQEIPTNAATAKSDIINYCKQKDFKFGLEIWSNADFEEEIAVNAQKYAFLIHEFFPEIAVLISNTAQAASATIIQIYEETGKPLDLIKNIVSCNLEKNSDELKAMVFETGHSPFQRKVPAFQGVRRNLDWSLLGGLPDGRVIALIGQPKVGKTSLIAQFCSLDLEKLTIIWFDCPPLPRDAKAFEIDILKAIFENFIDSMYVNEYLVKRISLDKMLEHVKVLSGDNILIIIDNCENLPRDSLKTINHELTNLLNKVELKALGIVFISSKSLKQHLHLLETEYVSPLWTQAELEDLLKYNSIDTTDSINNYVKVLHSITNGHPIVSLAMAQKYPSIKELLLERNILDDMPLVDKELSERTKTWMFDEILKDADDRNIVLCASPLVYPFSIEDLELLVREIYPLLTKPIKLIVGKLFGTIFEGQLGNRLNVGYVFKEVANAQTSEQFKTRIYLESAKNLIAIKNGKIDAWDVCKGINYSLFAQDFDKAIFWAAITLTRLLMDNVAEDVVKAIINRIDCIIYLKPPNNKNSLMHYIQAMHLFRRAFKRAGDLKEVAISLKNYEDAMEIGSKILDPFVIKANRVMFYAYEFIDYARIGDYKNAANAINHLEPLDISGYNLANKELLLLLDGLVSQIEPCDFPLDYYSKAIIDISPNDTDAIAYITSSFITWASKSAKAEIDNSGLLDKFEPLNLFSKFLVRTYEVQYEHEKDNRVNVITKLEAAYSIAKEWKCHSRSALRYLILIEADLKYNGQEDTAALKLYEEIIDCFSNINEKFYVGWCCKQIANLCIDNEHSYNYYKKAGEIFKQTGLDFEYSRILGEKGILLFKLGREIEALKIFNQIIDEYYIKNNTEFGTATIITVSLLYNIAKNEKPAEEDLKIKNGITHVGFKRGVFSTVLRGHHPQAGIACAYFELAECYRKYHQIDLARDCLELILLSDLDMVAEAHFYAQGVFELEPEYRKRAVHQYDGLVKLLDSEVPLESLLNYGRSLYVIWGFHEVKIIPPWDIKLLNALIGGARIMGPLSLDDQQRPACMLLLFLAVTTYEENEKVDSLKETLLSIVRPITNLLPVQIKRIIEI